MADATFVTRVCLRNYRSIGACQVQLGPLTFLVGPNGSGKSNFLDAIRFVTEALANTLDHAIRDRGGIDEVRRRSGGHPNNFAIRLDLRLANHFAHYAFEIRARPNGTWTVKNEECKLQSTEFVTYHYLAREGQVVEHSANLGALPASSPDRLFLVNASGLPALRPLYDGLTRMGFYNLNPEEIRELQSPDPGHLLRRDGSNAPSCLVQLEHADPARKQRLVESLGKVVPGVTGVEREALGPKETIEFRQEVQGQRHPWRFRAINMSDGTLRAFGVLLALNQAGNALPIRLIGIEEPETALHPAAVGVLTDALRDASRRTQVVVTSHSPDLLDDKRIADTELIAVVAEAGETLLGPLDAFGRRELSGHLSTAGELLRMDRLRPDPESSRPNQLNLFGSALEE